MSDPKRIRYLFFKNGLYPNMTKMKGYWMCLSKINH